MLKKHYFLFAALVVYQKDKLERTKPLNILITSDEQVVTRPQLGRAQQQAQVRFISEFTMEGLLVHVAEMPSDTQFAEGDQDAPSVNVSEGAVGIDPRETEDKE